VLIYKPMTYKNIFECKPVGLGPDEKHDLIKHPHYDWLYVDNIGVRWVKDEIAKKQYKTITEGDSLLCWRHDGGKDHTRSRMFTIYNAWVDPDFGVEKLVFYDHNPYNFRPENIIPMKKAGAKWRWEQREFIISTIDEMLRRDGSKGLRPEYWEMQGIPKNIIQYYTKGKKIPNVIKPREKKEGRKTYYAKWKRHFTPEEELDVISLYLNGMAAPDIARMYQEVEGKEDTPVLNLTQAVYKLVYKYDLNKK
jgi:hypothetical protein